MRLLRQWNHGPCFYCGRDTFRMGSDRHPPYKYTRDHILPKRLRNNLDHNDSTVTCCYDCNIKKGSTEVNEFVSVYLPHRIPFIDWELVKRIYNIYQVQFQ